MPLPAGVPAGVDVFMGAMMDKIKELDIVIVNFNNAKFTLCKEARVLYVPCATGDSWIFRNLETDELIYVSEGCTIIKLRDAGGIP